jgi:hypothetical protein
MRAAFFWCITSKEKLTCRYMGQDNGTLSCIDASFMEGQKSAGAWMHRSRPWVGFSFCRGIFFLQKENAENAGVSGTNFVWNGFKSLIAAASTPAEADLYP